MKDKALRRAEMIASRDRIAPQERARLAARLTRSLQGLPQYAAAHSVLATMSIGSEWSTRDFLQRAQADGKAIVLPRVAGKPGHLELHVVRDLERDLVPGVWGIPEPDPARCERVGLERVDLAWVPALAADRAGHRLGYGAGYFDKLLAGRGPRPYCVVALPAAFVVESLPHEPHDVPVDLVLTVQ